jgi:hypothetical protein
MDLSLVKTRSSGKNNSLLSFDTTWAMQKGTPPIILHCGGNMFTELLPCNSRIHRLSFDTTWTSEKMMHPTVFFVLFIVEMCFLGHCLKTVGRCIYRHTACREEFMKHDTEMDPGAITYINSASSMSSPM